MKIIEKKITEIVPYENNPRKNKEAVDAVAESIKEFGFKVPIVLDKENVIIAGHTRLLAAEKLELETVPVIYADDLSDEQIRAFRLADNKTGELAEWDFERLEHEIEALSDADIDLERFGFMLDNLEIPDGMFEESKPKEEKETEPKKVKCPKCGKWFEV